MECCEILHVNSVFLLGLDLTREAIARNLQRISGSPSSSRPSTWRDGESGGDRPGARTERPAPHNERDVAHQAGQPPDAALGERRRSQSPPTLRSTILAYRGRIDLFEAEHTGRFANK